MNQIKIGRFIADERKRKGYTQKQLSEKLGISDKTISKWERGNGFPEVSLLLPLCDELEITVNELLSGERVSEEDYRKNAEVNMVNLVREAQESKKENYFVCNGRDTYDSCGISIVFIVRNSGDGELAEGSAYRNRVSSGMWRNSDCVYS